MVWPSRSTRTAGRFQNGRTVPERHNGSQPSVILAPASKPRVDTCGDCLCAFLCAWSGYAHPTGLVVDWTGEGLQAWQERLAAASGASTVNQLLRKHGIKVGFLLLLLLLLPSQPCHNTVTSLFGCFVA